MPGQSLLQRLSHWRVLLAYQYGCPGKKLLFMGQDFAQWQEWQHEQELCWYLPRDVPSWSMSHRWSAALNQLYSSKKAMYECDSHEGFEWVDKESVSILSLIAQSLRLIVSSNMTSARTDHAFYVSICSMVMCEKGRCTCNI